MYSCRTTTTSTEGEPTKKTTTTTTTTTRKAACSYCEEAAGAGATSAEVVGVADAAADAAIVDADASPSVRRQRPLGRGVLLPGASGGSSTSRSKSAAIAGTSVTTERRAHYPTAATSVTISTTARTANYGSAKRCLVAHLLPNSSVGKLWCCWHGISIEGKGRGRRWSCPPVIGIPPKASLRRHYHHHHGSRTAARPSRRWRGPGEGARRRRRRRRRCGLSNATKLAPYPPTTTSTTPLPVPY